MILTDKAKTDFLEYYNNHSNNYLLSWTVFEDLPLVVQNALIIEWLDSVKLTITVQYCIDATFDSFLDIEKKEEIECSQFSKTRSEATQQAILKANETYNNLNTNENEK